MQQVNDLVGNIRKHNFVGYANIYLWRCNEENRMNEIDIDNYKKLVELDSKLGTTASEQLFHILNQTTQLDIIKV